MNLFGDERYPAQHPEYLRVAVEAAQAAIAEWLRGIDGNHVYLFEVEGVECALECFAGHWGTNARWRWGRLAAGDPDENENGENILLDVALGLSSGGRDNDVPAQTPRCRCTPKAICRWTRSKRAPRHAPKRTWKSSSCTGCSEAAGRALFLLASRIFHVPHMTRPAPPLGCVWVTDALLVGGLKNYTVKLPALTVERLAAAGRGLRHQSVEQRPVPSRRCRRALGRGG